jgi:hypothetical protein
VDERRFTPIVEAIQLSARLQQTTPLSPRCALDEAQCLHGASRRARVRAHLHQRSHRLHVPVNAALFTASTRQDPSTFTSTPSTTRLSGVTVLGAV